jgi:hypothetical protein
MRPTVTFPAILLAGLVLSGCVASTAPVGVLPRDPVPPPPSLAGTTAGRPSANQGSTTSAQRRGLSVPNRTTTPRP